MTAEDFLLWAGAEWNAYGYITSITGPVHTSELEDEYTIHFSASEQTVTFTVTNGSSISSVVTYFAVSTSNSTVPSSWYTSIQIMTPTNKYLWSYMKFNLNDGTSKETTKCVVGVYGDTGAVGPQGPKGDPGAGNVDTVDNIGVDYETTNVSLGALSYSRSQTLSGEQKSQLAANMGLIDLIYPVGSIYMSANNVNPATFLGGTWSQIKDRFLLSAGDSYLAGRTGGEASHTLTTQEIPAHTHGQASLVGTMKLRLCGSSPGSDIVTARSGTVTHAQEKWTTTTSLLGLGSSVTNPNRDVVTIDNSHTHTSVGGSGAHNNMPPYLVVYMWQRTA